MKRIVIAASYVVVIILSVFITMKTHEFIALSRTEGYWSEIRFLQACTDEYYDSYNKVPNDLKDLVEWAKNIGYSFKPVHPSYGMHVSYVPLTNDKCAFINLQYGSVHVCSFNDYANKARRDIESKRSRGVLDWGWVEQKY